MGLLNRGNPAAVAREVPIQSIALKEWPAVARVQYSLMHLLEMTAGAGAYLTTLVTLPQLHPVGGSPWRTSWSILVAWLVLLAVYWRQSRCAALWMHRLGFAVAVAAWPVALVAFPHELGFLLRLENVALFSGGIAFCSLAGTLAGLPVCLTTIVASGVRAAFAAKE